MEASAGCWDRGDSDAADIDAESAAGWAALRDVLTADLEGDFAGALAAVLAAVLVIFLVAALTAALVAAFAADFAGTLAGVTGGSASAICADCKTAGGITGSTGLPIGFFAAGLEAGLETGLAAPFFLVAGAVGAAFAEDFLTAFFADCLTAGCFAAADFGAFAGALAAGSSTFAAFTGEGLAAAALAGAVLGDFEAEDAGTTGDFEAVFFLRAGCANFVADFLAAFFDGGEEAAAGCATEGVVLRAAALVTRLMDAAAAGSEAG